MSKRGDEVPACHSSVIRLISLPGAAAADGLIELKLGLTIKLNQLEMSPDSNHIF